MVPALRNTTEEDGSGCPLTTGFLGYKIYGF